ncbi:MAG: SdpI family protein [Roseburia sp.]
MIGFGRYFLENAPKEINSTLGYRTFRSRKNQDTWIFAHNYCGKS